jgi:hypothetical protein
MSDAPIPARTPEQIDADFAEAFKDIHPIVPAKPLSWSERLKPYKKAIMKQRKRGLRWSQISEGMARKPVLLKVSEKILRATFGATDTAKSAISGGSSGTGRTATARPAPASAGPAATASTVPAAAPAPTAAAQPAAAPAEASIPPITAEEQKRYEASFSALIVPIVSTKMTRRDARSYASLALERWNPREAARFQQLLEMELNALDETNCSRYGVAPELIAGFKRKWK